MAKKILLASGCSYTDANFKSADSSLTPELSGGWPMWPELMAQELNLKVVNKGLSGRGADHILDSIVDQIAIYGDKIDIVAVLWSGCDRLPFFDYTWNPFADLTNDFYSRGDNIEDWKSNCGVSTTISDLWNSDGFSTHIYQRMIENQLRKMCAVVDICKANNIKLVMNQGISYFSWWCLDILLEHNRIGKNQYISNQTAARMFTRNAMFVKLNKSNNIIGWPFFGDLGGSCFDSRRIDNEASYISDKDRHPNAYGQTLLANEFLEKYYELYN